MKLLVLACAALIASFFSFQYFSKNNTNKSKLDNDYVVTELGDLSQKNLLSAVIVIEDLKTLKKADFSYQVKFNKTLNLNLQNGKVIERTDLDATENIFCLSAEALQSLNAVLIKSKVCKFEKKQVTDQICAQIIKPAYLDLLTSTENYQLGYAPDSCANVTIDLCDQKTQLELLDLVKKLAHSYSEKKCPAGF